MDGRVALDHGKMTIHLSRGLPDGKRNPPEVARLEAEGLSRVPRRDFLSACGRTEQQDRNGEQQTHLLKDDSPTRGPAAGGSSRSYRRDGDRRNAKLEVEPWPVSCFAF